VLISNVLKWKLKSAKYLTKKEIIIVDDQDSNPSLTSASDGARVDMHIWYAYPFVSNFLFNFIYGKVRKISFTICKSYGLMWQYLSMKFEDLSVIFDEKI